MYALDFEYDGQHLSDYGFIICDFDSSSGAMIATAGSKITFNTVSHRNGKKHGLVGSQYSECIQSTFDICKNPDINDDMWITNDEYRDLMRWLNRNEFLKLQIICEDDPDADPCFYEASFNVEKIKIGEILYGLRLSMETNKPFGYGQERCISWLFNDTAISHILRDESDEIGYIYPTLSIHCLADGDLLIRNDLTDCNMKIRNCRTGELITIYGDTQIIKTSYSTHKIYDDFNYDFFKIGNTISDRNNKISVSLPCKLDIKYRPIIKDAP